MLHVHLNDKRFDSPLPLTHALYWVTAANGNTFTFGQKLSQVDRSLVYHTLKTRLSSRFVGGRQPAAILSEWSKAYTKYVMRAIESGGLMPVTQSDMVYNELITREGQKLTSKLQQLNAGGL